VDKDMMNMAITQEEISALKKMIMYVKFSCEEAESLEYAGSYAVNSFLEKILELDYLGEIEKSFYDKGNIDNQDFICKKIEKYQSESGRNLSDDLCSSMMEQCILPFRKL
jgi:hypothetical protein